VFWVVLIVFMLVGLRTFKKIKTSLCGCFVMTEVLEDAIVVSNIGKLYRLYNKPVDRLIEALSFIRETSAS